MIALTIIALAGLVGFGFAKLLEPRRPARQWPVR